MDMWETFGIRVMGRDFHHDQAFNDLMLVDFPALLATSVLQGAVGLRLSVVAESYFFGWLFLLLGTLQWWVVGMVVAARRARRRNRRSADPA